MADARCDAGNDDAAGACRAHKTATVPSRKAQVLQMFELVRYAIMTALIVVIITALVGLVVRDETETRPAALAVYDNLFLYAPGGIHPMDGRTGRSDPSTIDLASFDDATLGRMMQHADNRFVGAKLTVHDAVESKDSVAFWNREYYDRYKPLTNSKGTGSALLRSTTHNVRVLTQGAAHPGTLTIELVVYR